ncbi:MAG: hypothetical protein HXY41_04415 [Chloroflexi bacterium]|nr:hypothetical protein [Chloroflexota bacterium]
MNAKTLAQWAGIPIRWNAGHDEILFDERLTVKETKSRLRGQLRPVVADDSACEPAQAVQYWMYNGISLPEHADIYNQLGIQYELTLLYPARLGHERSKTLGHIHSFPPGSRLNYAEVCEVLWGEAIFFFQTLDETARSAPFCYAVRARQGDKVVFPPNLHHLTINAGDEMLLFSDLICVETRGNYAGLSAMGGAAFHYGSTGWTRNTRYETVSALQVFEAEEYPDAHLTRELPLYSVIECCPDDLAWLTQPDRFQEAFPGLARLMPG